MSKAELIVHLLMVSFLVGVTSLVITLYGTFTWQPEVVVWAGCTFLVSCVAYGCLTKWSEKDVR